MKQGLCFICSCKMVLWPIRACLLFELFCNVSWPLQRVKAVELFNLLNLVDNTILPCYTLPLTQQHSFFRNLPP